MKFKRFLSILFVVFILNSCTYNNTTTDCENPDYSGCDTYQPEKGIISIFCTIDINNQRVPIVIYKGKISDSVEVLRDTVDTPQTDYDFPVNDFYSVKATYNTSKGIVVALDGAKIKLTSSVVCDSVCWELNSPEINLKLRKDLR